MATKIIKMAKSVSLTVKTVLYTTIISLSGCSGSGTEDSVPSNEVESASVNEPIIPSVDSIHVGAIATNSVDDADSPVISLGAANPTGENSFLTTVSSFDIVEPDSEVGYKSVTSALSGMVASTPVQEPMAEIPSSNTAIVTETPLVVEVQPEVETPQEVNSAEGVEAAPAAEQSAVTDSEVANIATAPVSSETEANIVDYTPVPIAPIDGVILPYGQSISLVWSVPVAILQAISGFEVAIADVASGEVTYRTNLVSTSNCTDQGQCAMEVISAGIPSIEGDNTWSVSSIGTNIAFNMAEASFTMESAPVLAETDKTETSIEEQNVEVASHSDDFLAIKADADAALADFDNWYVFRGSILNTDQGYHGKAAMNGLAQLYRVTDDPMYIDAAVRLGRKWIDSGRQVDSDGYLDWYGGLDSLSHLINLEHHEWRAADGISDILIEIQRTGYESIPGTKAKFIQFLEREVWQKWTNGHKIYSDGRIRSSRGSLLSWFAGRWAVIAMGLDQTHPTPGNNEYARYVNSTSGPYTESAFGTFLPTFISMEKNGQRKVPWWTNNDSRYQNKSDSSHAGDIMYAIMRAKQLGYDPGGFIDETLAVYKRLLDDKMFVTADGFSHYTDGTGAVNASNYSSAHGHSLSAALSDELKDRWVNYFRYNNPQHNDNPVRLIWMAGGLLWALNGGEL